MPCPFCRNELNPGATACGHCGAYLAISILSTVRQLLAIAWMAIGALSAWIFPNPTLGIIILVLAALYFLPKKKVVWYRR